MNFIEFSEIFAWPLCFLLIAVVFMFIFRKQIADVISRISKIEKMGVSMTRLGEQQEKKETNSETDLLDAVGPSPFVKKMEREIIKQLELEKTSDEKVKIERLTRHLAVTKISLTFEVIYNSIFGGQIALLNNLNVFRNQGININVVSQHIKMFRNTYRRELEKWTDKQYLQYLLDNSLINQEEDKLYITDNGVEFLTWMTQTGRNQVKQF